MHSRERALWVVVLAGVLLVASARALTAAEDVPATPTREVRLSGPAPKVFAQLGELYQVPVQVDPELPARPLNLQLGAADLATALRVATQLAGAFWTVQPDGRVLVAADTPQNRERYEAQVAKTFFLPGRTAEELTETVQLLREVLDMRRVNPNPRSNSILVRDTPLRLAVAEELLSQLQQDVAEVWVEALVLEVDRDLAQQYGVLPPSQVVAVHLGAGALAVTDIDSLLEAFQFLLAHGLLPPVFAAGTTPATDQMGITLPPFILVGGGETTYAVNLPGAELSLLHLLSVLRAWRHVNLRAREGQEASVFVGERFPVLATRYTSIRTTRRRGQVETAFPDTRYEELGIRLTVRPRVHPGREISLGLKLTQATLTAQQVNGIPVLANRTLEQQVRLRDGESLLVSGLVSRETAETRTGTPLLGWLPVIGHLFRQTAPRERETEQLVLLTPHIMRLPVTERLALRTFYVGTERDFSPVGAAPAPAVRPRPEAPPRPTPPPPAVQPPPPRPEVQPPPEEEEEPVEEEPTDEGEEQ